MTSEPGFYGRQPIELTPEHPVEPLPASVRAPLMVWSWPQQLGDRLGCFASVLYVQGDPTRPRSLAAWSTDPKQCYFDLNNLYGEDGGVYHYGSHRNKLGHDQVVINTAQVPAEVVGVVALLHLTEEVADLGVLGELPFTIVEEGGATLLTRRVGFDELQGNRAVVIGGLFCNAETGWTAHRLLIGSRSGRKSLLKNCFDLTLA